MDEPWFDDTDLDEEEKPVDELGDYDTFSAGVELGGLRNAAQIKILIGFVVKSLEAPIEKSRLIEVLQLHGLANYFDISQALEEQLDCANITADENGMLSITEKGRLAVSELESEIPRTVREKALDDAIRIQTFERRRSENRIEVEPCGSGFNVTFVVFSHNAELMRLTVYAADSYQVERIKTNFLNDPVSLYSSIISTLFA